MWGSPWPRLGSCPRVVVSAGCLKVLCLILSWKGNWVKVFKIVQMNLKLSFKRQHSRLGVGGPTRRAAASPVLPPPWFFWEKLSKPGEVILLLLHFLFSPFFNAMSLQIDFQKSAQNHQIVTHTAVHTVPWYLNKKKTSPQCQLFWWWRKMNFQLCLFVVNSFVSAVKRTGAEREKYKDSLRTR